VEGTGLRFSSYTTSVYDCNANMKILRKDEYWPYQVYGMLLFELKKKEKRKDMGK
jgi:hypothetical protein